MPTVREIINALLNELKAVLGEYINGTKVALKKRFQRILIAGILVTVLLALAIAFIGSASIFILVGSLKYLETFMPAWQAWYVIGLTSGVICALLFLVLFIFIRKQLKSE